MSNYEKHLDISRACVLLALDDLNVWYAGGKEFVAGMIVDSDNNGYPSKYAHCLAECADVIVIETGSIFYNQGDLYVQFVYNDKRLRVWKDTLILVAYTLPDQELGHAVSCLAKHVLTYKNINYICIPKKNTIIDKA